MLIQHAKCNLKLYTIEQIKEKQNGLIKNIRKLNDMEDPEFTDFLQLFSYRDAITPENQ